MCAFVVAFKRREIVHGLASQPQQSSQSGENCDAQRHTIYRAPSSEDDEHSLRYESVRIMLSRPQQPALSSLLACAVFSSQEAPEDHPQLCLAASHRGDTNQD
jgi:hypothetical protein